MSWNSALPLANVAPCPFVAGAGLPPLSRCGGPASLSAEPNRNGPEASEHARFRDPAPLARAGRGLSGPDALGLGRLAPGGRPGAGAARASPVLWLLQGQRQQAFQLFPTARHAACPGLPAGFLVRRADLGRRIHRRAAARAGIVHAAGGACLLPVPARLGLRACPHGRLFLEQARARISAGLGGRRPALHLRRRRAALARPCAARLAILNWETSRNG